MFWPNPENGPAEQEDWCRRVLMAFMPWIDEDLLQGDSQCFFDAYVDFMESSSDAVKSQVLRYLNANDELRAALMEKKKDYEELAKLKEQLGITDTEALEIQEIKTSPEEVAEGEKKLNEGQRDVYETVMAAVRSEDEWRKGKKAEHKPSRMFVSGVGGTGKTALIRQLAAKISLDYSIKGREKEEPAVLLSAPTGLAALSIKGNTLHSLLQLGVDQGANTNPMKQGELAVLFRNCRLLVIDEVSMVANTMLFKLCMRLLEIKNNDQAFGGMNILLFGDLLQIPPVRARDVFHRLSTRELRQTFHSVAMSYSLWDLFDYKELTQNMRQRADQGYAELLGRVRIGSPTEEDIRTLLSRKPLKENHAPRKATMEEAAQFYIDKWNTGEETVALFSKVQDVDEFNKKVQELLGLDVEEICATDTLERRSIRKEGSTKRPFLKVGLRRQDWGKSSYKIQQLLKRNKRKELVEGFQAGLADRLKIAVNTRVMLRRNLNVGAGLVNGAMGVVTQLIHDRRKQISTIMVKFDNIDDPVPIEKVSAKFELGGELNATRTQFPLLVAYAVTIHKSQGMTVKNIIANLDDAFSTGMVYVALSRATSLNGVFPIGFNPKKIKACEPALAQYKKLRQKIGIELLEEGNVQPLIKINFYGRRRRQGKPLLVNVRSTSNESVALHKDQRDVRMSDSSPEIVRRTTRSRTRKNRNVEEDEEINNNDTFDFPAVAYSNASMSALITNSTNFPWFANSGSDCFVNSVAWCIGATQMKTSISNGDPTNPICSFFFSIDMSDNNGLRHSTRPLRELFPAFLENERHRHYDAVEFYEKFVESLPDVLTRQMSVERKSYVACMDCQKETLEMESKESALRPTYSREFAGISSQMETTVIKDSTTMDCVVCGTSTPHIRWLSYDAFDTRVIGMEFTWSDDPSAHVFNRPEEVTLFGEKWRLKGAVKYHAGADLEEVGHYVSLVEKEDEWYLLDDQKTSEEPQRLPRNHSMIRMLIFEKI